MVTETQRQIQGLLVIGDIFGFPGAGDLSNFDGRPYSILRLADISGRPDLSGEGLHDHLFKGGGLEHAVHKLCKIDASACIGSVLAPAERCCGTRLNGGCGSRR
jgi:hypothetical protein